MEFITFVIVTILFVWLLSRWFLRDFVILSFKLPSNKWHSILGWGQILNTKNIIQTSFKVGAKYGPNCIYWMGPIPIFLTSDPKAIETIFLSKNCINKPPIIMDGMTWVVGLGLVTRREPRWGRIRKLMNKAFSTINLISFFPIFHQQINIMIDEINENIEREKPVDMLNLFEQLTLKNATRTILKRELNTSKYDFATLTHYFHDIMDYTASACAEVFCKLFVIRKIFEFTRFKNAMKGQAIFHDIINESTEVLLKGDATHSNELPEVKSVLDYALNGVHENVLTLKELPGELMQFLTAAYDTTSKALYLTILMLAMHPEYQERAYEEIQSVLIGQNDDNLSTEQLNQLSYLEMIMNETMRVTPVIPMVIREIGEGNTTIDNIKFPPGLCIAIDIFRLHRRKDLWGEDAEVFNPDNFLPLNFDSKHPYSFIPFTKGLRFCIGQKYALLFMKITLSKLIKRFRFSTDFKYENLRFHNHIVLHLVEEPQIYVKRRGQ